MKKLLLASAAIIASSTIFTSTAALAMMPWGGTTINRVTMPITAEQWASTTNARVIINMDASVKEGELNKLRTSILDKLNQLAKADWNITRFDRTESTSGLAQVRIEAETRVPEANLGALNEKAKSLSKPGETYRIATIDFSPGLPEMEKIRAALRNKILADAKVELDKLNAAYPDQKYYLHDVQFNENLVSPGPVMLAATMEKDANGGTVVTKTTSLAVSNKITMTAIVTFGSTIKPAAPVVS